MKFTLPLKFTFPFKFTFPTEHCCSFRKTAWSLPVPFLKLREDVIRHFLVLPLVGVPGPLDKDQVVFIGRGHMIV